MTNRMSIVGTDAYKAHLLRTTLFGWPALIAFAAALLALGGYGVQTGDYSPVGALLAIVLFGMHVAHRFIAQRLEDESIPVLPNASPAAWLSADLIRSLRGKKTFGAGDLLLACVASKRGRFILDEMNVTPAELLGSASHIVDETVDVREFLAYAAGTLRDFGESRIGPGVVLFFFFSHVDACTRVLHKADMSEDDLLGLIRWESVHHRFSAHESSLSPAALRRNASLGRSWVAGYTDALDSLTKEMHPAAREIDVVIHRKETEDALRALTRGDKRNVLLIGKPGVGKSRLIENIAATLRAKERAANSPFTRILVLQTAKLLSGVGEPDKFLLKAISRAQSSGKFILVIKDFPTLLKSADENLKAVLMKCLDTSGFGVIAVADALDYHSLVKSDSSMDGKFEKIPVEDATDEETMNVLMSHHFDGKHRSVRITYKALKSILELSKRYISSNVGLPGKAIDVMDEATSRAAERGHAYVTEDHVRETVSTKGRVNVNKVGAEEKEKLLALESVMKKRIIGQDDAVKAVAGALKRARLDLSDRKRPIGTFLFLGPTGVGKTQTAKVLAEEYFGSVDAIIRLDMNEYSSAGSAEGIVGSSSSGDGFLARRVQDKPFSLILLDEIEKAHPNVLNMFLQILDEGFLNDNRGVRTDFRNTIIIATSNAGALFIRDFVREHKDYDKNRFKEALIETILHDKSFSPEFVNRFDDIVLFRPLTHEGASHVATMMLEDVINDIRRRRGIEVKVEQDVIAGLVERGYSVEFGAREMRRTVTGMIEDYLADYLLKHDVSRGEEIVIKNGDLKW